MSHDTVLFAAGLLTGVLVAVVVVVAVTVPEALSALVAIGVVVESATLLVVVLDRFRAKPPKGRCP